MALPSLPPKQLTLICEIGAVNTTGCVIVAVAVFVQDIPSVTVTVYVPAVRLLIVAVVALFDHR